MQTAISVPETESWFGLGLQTLQGFLAESGTSSVHQQAILQCLYQQRHDRYLNSLPASIRKRVKHQPQAKVLSKQCSRDGTVKWLIGFQDQANVEAVLIPESGRDTLCISSQVGCAFGCTFCATGQMGWYRHLSCGEILEQLLIANEYLARYGRQITNVVFMGMGEPLHNVEAVLDACDILCHDNGFGLSRYRVTISTVGLVPAIKKMIGRTNVSLALSLHAPNDKIRQQMMPIARKYSIQQTLDAIRDYLDSLPDQRSVFIEYTLMSGYNDSADQAEELARLLSGLPCKINLIPCNPVDGASMITSDRSQVYNFMRILCQNGHRVTVRQTRGEDIDAACGQLAKLSKRID